MEKNNKLIFMLMVICILLIGGCAKSDDDKSLKADAVKFSSEYNRVTDDNVFVYKTPEEIIDIIKHGTGVTYLGFPGCPWCQAYVEYLNDIAKEEGIEKIYYTNTKELKENDMDTYYKIVELLKDYLEYNEEGKPWIYVPNVTFIVNGEIIGNDNETAKDTGGISDPAEYWTTDKVSDLKSRLANYMKEVNKALTTCSDECNS